MQTQHASNIHFNLEPWINIRTEFRLNLKWPENENDNLNAEKSREAQVTSLGRVCRWKVSGKAPADNPLNKAMSVILSQQFMAVFCSRRGKWWKLTWALATPNLSPYLATGGGIIFALFPQGKTNFLVIHSSIDFMSFVHLLSTNRVMSSYETSVVRFRVLVALVHSNVKHG